MSSAGARVAPSRSSTVGPRAIASASPRLPLSSSGSRSRLDFFFTTRALGAPNQKAITGKKEVAQLNSPPATRRTVALAIQMPPLGASTFMTYEWPPRHHTFHCFAGC
jgi:hypothetical protein